MTFEKQCTIKLDLTVLDTVLALDIGSIPTDLEMYPAALTLFSASKRRSLQSEVPTNTTITEYSELILGCRFQQTRRDVETGERRTC